MAICDIGASLLTFCPVWETTIWGRVPRIISFVLTACVSLAPSMTVAQEEQIRARQATSLTGDHLVDMNSYTELMPIDANDAIAEITCRHKEIVSHFPNLKASGFLLQTMNGAADPPAALRVWLDISKSAFRFEYGYSKDDEPDQTEESAQNFPVRVARITTPSCIVLAFGKADDGIEAVEIRPADSTVGESPIRHSFFGYNEEPDLFWGAINSEIANGRVVATAEQNETVLILTLRNSRRPELSYRRFVFDRKRDFRLIVLEDHRTPAQASVYRSEYGEVGGVAVLKSRREYTLDLQQDLITSSREWLFNEVNTDPLESEAFSLSSLPVDTENCFVTDHRTGRAQQVKFEEYMQQH